MGRRTPRLAMRFPPHNHPVDEVVTVISGTFKLGMGGLPIRARQPRCLPAASLWCRPKMAHFAYVDEETVVRITTIEPWDLTYVNPEDNPRNT